MTRRFVGAIPRAKPLLIPAKYLIICASVLIVSSVFSFIAGGTVQEKYWTHKILR